MSSDSPEEYEQRTPTAMTHGTEHSDNADDRLQIKDRIRELRRVPARDLLPNPKNWRRHPKAQADALRGLLK
jgi:hypothetical protein